MTINPDHVVNKAMCKAYGCPCLGTMSTNTKGANDWVCGFHFPHDAGEWQAITVELNRMRWLATAIGKLRLAYSCDRDVWAQAATAAKREIALNMRSDLLPAKDEIGSVWIARLDKALTDACKPPKSTQESLAFVAG